MSPTAPNSGVAILRPVESGEDTLQLFLATLDREPGALNRLLEQLRPRLVLWCAARMSPKLKLKLDPEDLAQDVMIRVNGSIGTFEGRDLAAFYGWLFTLAGNTIRDAAKHYNAVKRQRPEPRSVSQTTPSARASLETLSVEPDADERARKLREMKERLIS